jgi:hypothetical protein
MTKAIVVIVIVLAVLAGILLNFRKSAKAGMPSEDVLKRATQRARQLEAEEKRDE